MNADLLVLLTFISFFLSSLHMQYLFDEGRIVELNNQAKHSVVNNMTDTHRVHLIFDYVDDHPIKQRFKLSPGEVIHQTRRSIDLAREAALPDARRKAPTFVIIGAQVRSLHIRLFLNVLLLS
jgi:hypothetical protein